MVHVVHEQLPHVLNRGGGIHWTGQAKLGISVWVRAKMLEVRMAEQDHVNSGSNPGGKCKGEARGREVGQNILFELG